MIALETQAIERVLQLLERSGCRRRLAIHQAILAHQPGLFGDDARNPRSVLLLREGVGGAEAYGAGYADPAVGWLSNQIRSATLLAPRSWEGKLRSTVGSVSTGVIETWMLRRTSETRKRSPASVRRLGPDDGRLFGAIAPPWALFGWSSYRLMIERGAAFGVKGDPGLIALAWVNEQTYSQDSIGVYTLERYRRLGLARATSAALLDHIVNARRKTPVWTVAAENEPSKALARSLGFAPTGVETLLRWSRKSAAVE